MQRQLLLPDNLTKSQFIALAERKPITDDIGDLYYFRLEITELGNRAHNYPLYRVGPTHIIDFPTFDSATYYMKKYCQELELYSCRITQYLLENPYQRCAKWLFDGHGELLDCTIVHETGTPEETHFFGRTNDKQRFEHDQIVELLHDDEVMLALIVIPVPTPEICWNVYSASPDSYNVNYHNDTYLILADESGELAGAIPTSLMEPQFPISKELHAQILARYDIMVKNAMNRNKSSVHNISTIYD